MESLDIFVMAYNEQESLERTVNEIHSTLNDIGIPFEITIIDDGSTDQTGVKAERLCLSLPRVQVVHHPQNQGLGGVYHTGFSMATNDLITFLPADGQYPPVIITQFLPYTSQYDLVLGYLPERKGSFLGVVFSRAERVLYKILFGTLPQFQGIFMAHRIMLDEISLKSSGRGWAVVLEFIIKSSRGKYKIISLPTIYHPRVSGKSKVNNPRTVWSNLKQALILRKYI